MDYLLDILIILIAARRSGLIWIILAVLFIGGIALLGDLFD